MKRCPKCNRIETDEALKFCRVDGAPLINDSASIGAEAGTAQLGSSPDASEVHTSILPHRTDADISRTTGPTTALPVPTPSTTGALVKPKSRRTIAIVVVITAAFAALAAVVVNSSLLRRTSPVVESIAVMPFVNESGNSEFEYLSDGMTETLIKSLSNLPNLNVKPRSSVFRYKGKDTNLQTVAKELNVQAVLNGRVVQRGDQLAVSLELIDAQEERVIWTEKYERKSSELVALQSEIARDVSTKLKSKLSGAEENQVTKIATADPTAYQAYLKGRYYWNRRTAENIKRATEQFKAAIGRDPNYALAYAGLADCYALMPEYEGTPVSETAPQATAFAERAIAIDNQLAEPHATLGIVAQQLWQWVESEKEYKRAIEINPNYATAYHWYSILLKNLGRNNEAATMIKRAAELDPLSGAIGVNVSMIYQMENNHEASVENCLKLIELDPNFGRAYEYLGLSYLKLGRKAEAIKAMERAVELTNRQNVVLSELGYVYGATGNRAAAISVLKELEAKYARKEAAGHEVAAVYSGLGDKDKAFEWLEKDFQARDGRLTTFRWEIQFEPLRDDPRFKDLLKRMNLPV